jgi:hypothetical protein
MKTIGSVRLGSVKGTDDLKKLLPASFSEVDTFLNLEFNEPLPFSIDK